jgi:hypothetical protein
MSLECTTEDCRNHTSTYLCTQCVTDLQAWLDKIPDLIEALYVTIAKLDNVRPVGGGGGGGSKPGSAAPLNLDAMQLQANLATVGPDAKAYALDERAAGLAWIIQDWSVKAELLVSGPEAETINHAALKARVQDIAPPMPTRQLIPWLREKAGISVKGQQIRDWARRGKLSPAEREPSPTYHPHEVLAAWHQTRTEEAR